MTRFLLLRVQLQSYHKLYSTVSQDTIKQVQTLVETEWKDRLTKLQDESAPLILTVVGESHTDSTRLLSTLLKVPKNVILKPSPLQSLLHIQYGPQLQFIEGKSSTTTVDCPSPWLEQHKNVSIFNLIGLNQQSQVIKDLIYKSSIVVLVTDTIRSLSSSKELELVNEFKSKPNFLVYVNQFPPSTTTVDSNTDTDLESTHILEAIKEKLGNVQFFKGNLQDSNQLEPLEQSLSSLVANQTRTRQKALHYAACKALESYNSTLLDSQSTLEQISKNLSSASLQIQGLQKSLMEEFTESDLSTLQRILVSSNQGTRDFFKTVSFMKLFFKADHLAKDLGYVLAQYPLQKGNLQISFAMGVLQQAKRNMEDILRIELNNVSSIYPNLSLDISRILSLLETSTYKSPEPSVLTNVIQEYDLQEEIQTLEPRAQRIIYSTFATQVFVTVFGLLGTHFGVPWAISIPCTLIGYSLVFLWKSMRWSNVQDAFISRLASKEKVLIDRLRELYQEQIKLHIVEPSTSTMALMEESLDSQLRFIKNKQESVNQLETLLKSV